MAKSPVSKSAKPAAKAPAKKAAVKPAPKKAAPAKAPPKNAAPAVAKKAHAGEKAPAKKAAPVAKKAPAKAAGPAKGQYQQLLEAKQQKQRAGTSYPSPNAYQGGRGDGTARGSEHAGDADTHEAEVKSREPSPEAEFGSGNVTHARGNQGMRKQG